MKKTKPIYTVDGLMKEHGLSNADVAARWKTKLSRTAVSKWRNFIQQPKDSQDREQLAKILGVKSKNIQWKKEVK